MNASISLWPVGSIPAEPARLALGNRASIAAARESNALERDWLAEQLPALGLIVFPGSAGFLLLKLQKDRNGFDFWRQLLFENRIVLRSCANFEKLNQQFIRTGVRKRPENQLLVTALRSVLGP